MTNLIPQLRADKNGKLVTRHVNAAPQQGAGKSIPQPKLGVKTPAPVTDIMDQPSIMRAFIHGGGRNDITEALKRDFDFDPDADAEVTSRQWYAAMGAGLGEVQLRHFLLAGFTNVDDMIDYAHENDRRFARSVPPGILARRKKWTDSCLEAGITRDRFKEADKNFGSYSIREKVLEDFSLKGEASDVVELFADSPASTRAVYMPYLWEGQIRLEKLKQAGLKRVKTFGPWLESKEPEDFDRAVEVIKTEEKRKTPYGEVRGRVAARLYFDARFERERSDSISEPAAFGTSGYAIERVLAGMTDDEAFAFIKHHDEAQAIVVSSAGNGENVTLPSPDESIAYYRLGLLPEETAHGLINGISAESVRGVKAGMKSAVAEGWL